MRKIGGLEIFFGSLFMALSFALALTCGLTLHSTGIWIFQSEVLLWILGYLVFLTVEILRNRLFFHFFPLPEGEIPMGSKAEYLEILANYLRWRAQFCDASGELLPRYRLQPMVASFMRDAPPSTRRESIPVPRGPVEVW